MPELESTKMIRLHRLAQRCIFKIFSTTFASFVTFAYLFVLFNGVYQVSFLTAFFWLLPFPAMVGLTSYCMYRREYSIPLLY